MSSKRHQSLLHYIQLTFFCTEKDKLNTHLLNSTFPVLYLFSQVLFLIFSRNPTSFTLLFPPDSTIIFSVLQLQRVQFKISNSRILYCIYTPIITTQTSPSLQPSWQCRPPCCPPPQQETPAPQTRSSCPLNETQLQQGSTKDTACTRPRHRDSTVCRCC